MTSGAHAEGLGDRTAPVQPPGIWLPTATFVRVTLCAATGIAVPVTALPTVGPPVAALLVAQFVGACGEELGWR